MSNEKETEDNWNNVWKELLELPDGSINREALKHELHEYSRMMHGVGKITSHLGDNTMWWPARDLEEIFQHLKEKGYYET